MSTDLIALVVALALGTAVIVLGLRRNLSETARNGLSRFGADPERQTATLGLYEGEEKPRCPVSPRLAVPLYLLIALVQGASAMKASDDWLLHAALAALAVVAAVVYVLRNARRTGTFWGQPSH
ncbi:MAG TPA: hypothetical protein VFJ57_03570 [Solirubrobacterales bacterium]|nr:hypothetical protein [Solirubrobacterales bacterium]